MKSGAEGAGYIPRAFPHGTQERKSREALDRLENTHPARMNGMKRDNNVGRARSFRGFLL